MNTQAALLVQGQSSRLLSSMTRNAQALLLFLFLTFFQLPQNTSFCFSQMLHSWLTKHRRWFCFLRRFRYSALLKIILSHCLVSLSPALILPNSLNYILGRMTNCHKVGEHKMFCRKSLNSLLFFVGKSGRRLYKNLISMIAKNKSLPCEATLDAQESLSGWAAPETGKDPARRQALTCSPCCPTS